MLRLYLENCNSVDRASSVKLTAFNRALRENKRHVEAISIELQFPRSSLHDHINTLEIGLPEPQNCDNMPMMSDGTPLDRLEAESIRILREAHARLPRLVMLWSVGKDSTVMLWLARKAFLGQVPFPLLHVDTSFKIPEMIAHRDRLARAWGLRMIVSSNTEALAAKRTYPDGALDRLGCCAELKTRALRDAISGKGQRNRLDLSTGKYIKDTDQAPYNGVIAGIRADEEGTRSKERHFSPRTPDNAWVLEEQPPEFWNQFQTDVPEGGHVRVHPLLDWRELDVWEYIARENIPTTDLYYDQGEGLRYRSLGCAPCTQAVASCARTPQEIVSELRDGALRDVAERAGRAQDDEDRGTLERLRRAGYM
jgi:sulfate adenylyltransferase subunit 2